MPAAQEALAGLARVFWDAALREVEGELDAEEAKDGHTTNRKEDGEKIS